MRRASLSPAAGTAAARTWLGRLAQTCYDHRRRVLVAWIVGLVGLIVVGAFAVTGRFDNKLSGGHSES